MSTSIKYVQLEYEYVCKVSKLECEYIYKVSKLECEYIYKVSKLECEYVSKILTVKPRKTSLGESMQSFIARSRFHCIDTTFITLYNYFD